MAHTVQNEKVERIYRAMRKMLRAISLYSRQMEVQHHLTGPQMVILREMIAEGAHTPSELARKVFLSQATVTGILDRLETMGLLKRERRGEDKRRVMIKLTPEGRQAALNLPLPLLSESFRDRLADLPPDEQDRLVRGFERMVDMMNAAAPPDKKGSGAFY